MKGERTFSRSIALAHVVSDSNLQTLAELLRAVTGKGEVSIHPTLVLLFSSSNTR